MGGRINVCESFKGYAAQVYTRGVRVRHDHVAPERICIGSAGGSSPDGEGWGNPTAQPHGFDQRVYLIPYVDTMGITWPH
jgi:hypothetical protein